MPKTGDQLPGFLDHVPLQPIYLSMAIGLANNSAECSSTEPPSGQSCSYLKSYVEKGGGYIVDTNGCQYN